jgi:hypothetical protein
MPISKEDSDRWFRRDPIPGTCFHLNDSVRILAGPDSGEYGAVISLLDLHPEPIYLVEAATDGHDVRVRQAELQLIPDS